MDELQILYSVMLLPPGIVLLSAVMSATDLRHQARLDIESFLILASAPHSLGQVFVLQRLFFSMDFQWWPWLWFVYFSITFPLSIRFAFRHWNAGGLRKQCELAFSLLYFGAHWLGYAFGTFVVPPL